MEFPPLIVPDVNVMVSGTTISKHAPSQVMQAWKNDQIEIASSEPILSELQRVLAYPRIKKLARMTSEEMAHFVDGIRESAIMVSGTASVEVSPDLDDNKFFACAIEAEADYIVSGDKKHVLSVGEYQGVKTISPSDFVNDVLATQKAA